MKSEQQIRERLKEIEESQDIIDMKDKLLWLTKGKIEVLEWVLE